MSQADVLLRIRGEEIPKSDFERYWRNLPVSYRDMKKEYVFEKFVFERLKVADGMAAGWHKQPAFVLRSRAEAGKRLEKAFLNRFAADSLSRKLYADETRRFSEGEWLKISLITIPVLQNAGKKAEVQAVVRLDTVYQRLGKGEDFGKYACVNARWVPAYELLQEVSGHLSALSVGEYSKPFISPLGAHIVKLEERGGKQSDVSFDSFLQACAENETLVKHLGLMEKYGLEASGANCAEYCKDSRDSLLVSMWNARHGLSEDVKADSVAVELYYKKHKSQYGWTLPHFKGGVVYCARKADVSRLKKKLKKLSLQDWAGEVDRWNALHPADSVHMETGLYRIGKNPYVDKLAFKCGSLPSHPERYVFVLGKRLKKGPDSYLDVYDKVEKDYVLSERKSLIDSLKSHLGVEINQDVLKTVNCGGNN